MSKSYPTSLKHFIRQFEKIITSSREFLSDIDEATFLLKPDQDSWSVGECYSHLIQTGNLYLGKVNEGMQTARAKDAPPESPMSLRLHMKWFVQYLEPPVSVKAKAPGAFHPKSDSVLNKDQVLQQFLDQQNAYLMHLTTAQESNIDLSNIKVSNPLFSFVGMTVAECIAVTEAHTRRHMKQAEKVLEQVSS